MKLNKRLSNYFHISKIIFLLLFFFILSGQPLPAQIQVSHTKQVNLNDIAVLAITDSLHTFDASVFADIEQYPERQAMMPDGKFEALTKTYLVRTEDRIVLIDSGLGTESGVDGKTLEILIANGITPDQVTDILLTHMDVDHISGLLHQNHAVYPNATLRIARTEYEAWIVNGQDREPEYIALARRVIGLYNERIELFEYGDAVLPGIVAQDIRGHTAGHTGFDITSGDKGLTIVGDMLHVAPIQMRFTNYCAIYDVNPVIAAISREQTLARIYREDRLIAGMHFNEIGKVRPATTGGYAIIPE